MRRALLSIVSLTAFTGILVAAFWGGRPAGKKPPAPTQPGIVEVPKPNDEPPKPPVSLLGVEPNPGPDDEWRGARVGVEGRKEISAALALYESSREVAVLSGLLRGAALAKREMDLLWGTKKAVELPVVRAPWIVAVEETPDASAPVIAADLAAALGEFHADFRARFKSLFESRPPDPGWIAPVVVLASRDEYLRRAKPPAFAISHTNLHSGWAFLSRGRRELKESALHEATWQCWIALARARAPREGIPTASLAAWFWNGTAEFLSAARPDGQAHLHPGKGVSRNLTDVRAAVREKKMKPLPALLAPTFADLDASPDPREAFAVASQSWAFVAFLEMSGDGKRRGELDRYAESELSGKGGLEAAKACFGDLEVLDREYREFVKQLKQ
ncbi:MAG: hypothetical protein AAB074_04070 [Planctomycetota bacterium]